VLDCIEFDDRLRWLDGLDDVAFLAMDLENLGSPHLADRFLDWYAEFAADPAPASLRHHYRAYRAFVRAKVACLRHAQGDASAADDANQHAALTLDHLRSGEVVLILVGGGPGTGKSTLAGQLADRLGAVVLSSDRIRKELAGLDPDRSAAAPYQHGIYTAEWTDRTYTELIRRASTLLGHGETVIVDASWTAARHRHAADQLATATHSRLVPIQCQIPTHIAFHRIRNRSGSASDADATIAAAMAAPAAPGPRATLTSLRRSATTGYRCQPSKRRARCPGRSCAMALRPVGLRSRMRA
jgi:predicted kinase